MYVNRAKHLPEFADDRVGSWREEMMRCLRLGERDQRKLLHHQLTNYSNVRILYNAVPKCGSLALNKAFSSMVTQSYIKDMFRVVKYLPKDFREPRNSTQQVGI